MPAQQNIRRNIAETGQNLYINRWWSGLVTQRSPLFTPVSALGLQIIAKHDTLIDGLNAEISNTMTVQRRPGFPRFCSQQFGASDYPLGFYSFKNLSGAIYPMVDTPTAAWTFTTSAITSVFTKSTTQQTMFQSVGSMLYACDGTSAWKWDGTTQRNWGISTPLTAPTLSFSAGSLSPTNGYQYVYVYKCSATGHVSTASPVSANTGALTSQNITLTGTRSTDPQVDTIEIYRTVDGGALFYFLADIANPGAGSWTYTDSTADSGLVIGTVAPVAHANDAPPSGISLVKFHMGRMFVATGNLVYFGGGPDTTNGVPEETFPPANVFKFPGKVTAMASTTNGLLVFTADDAYVILGVDTASFWSRLWQKNFGVQSQNCVAQDGDTVFVFTSKAQLFEISDSLAEIGFNIGDKLLANFPPASSYLTLHRNGTDTGLFISNGTDSVFRYAPNFQCWCPLAQPVNGIRALHSMETSTAVYTLLMGRTAGNGYILGRSLSTFQDDSNSYDAFITVGSLVLAPPGETAKLTSALLEVMPVGTYPSLYVLPNEVNATSGPQFIGLPNPVPDPPQLPASSSVTANRHYFKASTLPIPQMFRHLQVKVDFGTQNAKSELLGLAIQ